MLDKKKWFRKMREFVGKKIIFTNENILRNK